jgi:hypothetical protein
MSSSKIFRVYEKISINSFRKKNIVSLSSKMVLDIHKLQRYIIRLIYLRVLSYKCLLLSHCAAFSANTTISAPLQSFIHYVYSFILYFNIYNARRALSFYVFVKHATVIYIYLLPVTYYIMYASYYMFLIYYLFYFITATLFNKLRNGVATLPTRIKRYTVLRSPHADKKSREQFELRIHKRVFSFNSFFSSYNNYTCFMHNSAFLCAYAHTYILYKYDSF